VDAELLALDSEVEHRVYPMIGVSTVLTSENIVKSVAAFLNCSTGGTLAIGISDDKHVVGLDADFLAKGMGIDNYVNAITQGLVSACGAGPVTLHTRVRPEQITDRWVVLVDVTPSAKPVFARSSKQDEVFYVRANNTTRQLGIAEAHEYISSRWPA
jgi:Schlafen, AlbA_2